MGIHDSIDAKVATANDFHICYLCDLCVCVCVCVNIVMVFMYVIYCNSNTHCDFKRLSEDDDARRTVTSNRDCEVLGMDLSFAEGRPRRIEDSGLSFSWATSANQKVPSNFLR